MEITAKHNAELESKKMQLHWMLQITKAINYNLPADQLFKIYQSVLQQHLKVGRAALFVNEDGWKKIFSFGVDDETDIEPEIYLNLIASLGDKKISSPERLKNDESIIPVYHNNKLLAYAITGAISGKEDFSKQEILPFIHTITNIIVVAIENKRLTKESILQAALKKELELAAEVQEMLIPKQIFANENLEVNAIYLPHQQIGGDYYDFIKISNDEFIVCMADVSGKGIAAALLMSNFQASLHALVKHTSSLKQLVEELNSAVNKTARGEKYITFFIAHINTSTGNVDYINAGHNPPVVFTDGTVYFLDSGTTGLGMFDELPFLNEGKIALSHDSLLFCYTDGITDLENNDGLQFGLDNLTQSVASHLQHESLETFHHWFISELDNYRKGALHVDDVTMLSCRLKKKK